MISYRYIYYPYDLLHCTMIQLVNSEKIKSITNKEKREYLTLALAYNGQAFISELQKRNEFNSKRPKNFLNSACLMNLPLICLKTNMFI